MAWLKRTPRVRTGDVVDLVERRVLAASQFEPAMRIAGRLPDGAGWLRSIELVLLALAAVLFVAGIVCIVAFNWAQIGRWGKFALAEAVIVLLAGAALWRGLGTTLGKSLLTVAAALIGPMLALFGQTYQTGADTFELFRGWATLALPLVVASCFAPAWLLWLGIVEVGVVSWVFAYDLWWMLWFGRIPNWLMACVFNGAVLVIWEAAAHRFDWLRGRLGPRLLALVTLGLLTAVTCAAIFGFHDESMRWGVALWLLAMGAGWYFYRHKDVELGMLSLGWVAATVVVMAALIRFSIATKLEGLGLWLGAALLVGASAYGRMWLKAAAADADARDDGGTRTPPAPASGAASR